MRNKRSADGDIKCLLCGSKTYKKIFSYKTPDRYETAIGVEPQGYFRYWVRCSDCNFHYSVYSRPPKLIHSIYKHAYRDSGANWRAETAENTFRKITALPEKESETKQRVRWIKNAMERSWTAGMVRKIAPPCTVLDIGGGAAIFAFAFQDKKWKSHIVDPATNNTFVRTKLKIPLVQASYKPRQFGKSFTLISLIYVLEHVANPLTFLSTVKKDMAEDSFIFIEVPDSIAFRLKLKNDDIFNACHLWMFDPESLTRLLALCGFEALDIRRLKTMRGHYALMVLAKQT